MQTSIQIRITNSGCDITVGEQTQRFTDLAAAAEFTRLRLEAADRLRELSSRCE